MKPFIFIGPTLSVEEAQSHLDAVYLPPVKYGDVYRITQLYQPQVIAIIDGYFNQVPAVWHKEILWAMSRGASVLGASSMGALRAAELEPLGMIGLGKIFEGYQKSILPPYVDEIFEDDDEVAVTHAPAELGYETLSEAMVNIRFTLAKAQQQKIIDLQSRNILIRIAKELFYPQRNFQLILDLAQQQGMVESQTSHLSQWINDNKVDQKKTDAIALLKHVKDQIQITSNKNNHSAFVHTSQWQCAINEIDQSHRIEHIALNELRLQGPRYFEVLDLALNSIFTHNHDNNLIEVDELTSLHQSTDCIDKQLSHDWQHMNNQSILAQLSQVESDQRLLSYLLQTGELESLQQRAIDKQTTLSEKNIPNSVELSDIDLLQLADWYFSQCLTLELPNRLEDYAAKLGFSDMDSFYDMILREYYYKQEL